MMTKEELNKIKARLYAIPEGVKDRVGEVSKAARRVLDDDVENLINEIESQRMLLAEATRLMAQRDGDKHA